MPAWVIFMCQMFQIIEEENMLMRSFMFTAGNKGTFCSTSLDEKDPPPFHYCRKHILHR